jgi:hypothetical protein
MPKRIMDYLKTPNYYSENIEDHTEEENENENHVVTSQEASAVANNDENAVYEIHNVANGNDGSVG